MNKHVIEDAKRCLQCQKPMCTQGCPIRTPIKQAIGLLLDSKIGEAGKLLYENNPLSLVCAHVCPQENQCEGHCVLGKKGMPVQISAIEQYISDYYLSIHKPESGGEKKAKVAIIGSGPAGITLAIMLTRKGYDITVYEGNDRIGGILRYGIPEFRLPKSILDRLMNVMVESGIKIRPNTTIGANLNIDDLFRDGFKAIFIGTGVWRPRRLNVKGESLGHVHYAIEYLRNPDVYRLGKRVAVIGAGNVAMDAARTAFRHGAEEVTVLCHGDESTITARDIEAQYAKIDGAEFVLNKSAAEFTDDGLITVDTEAYEEDGVKGFRPIPGTEAPFPADSVIIAISQGPRSVIVSSTMGIEITDSGLVAVDDCGRTTREGIFASGDVVTGAKTVVEAAKVSKRVADAIDGYVTDRYLEPKPGYAWPHPPKAEGAQTAP